MYKAEVNTVVRGLLKAWGISDDEIEIQLSNTKDQLFVESANGRYLDKLGSNVGVDRDPGLGISDDDFRKLIPVMSFYPKQVRKTIIALLDVFWGSGFTRPNVNSGNVEPFNLGPATTLGGTSTFSKNSKIVKGIGTQYTLEVYPGMYIKPNTFSGITYAKVSAVIDDTSLELSAPWDHNYSVNTIVVSTPIRELKYRVDGNEEHTIRLIPSAFADITAVTIAELTTFINKLEEHKYHLTASVFLDPILGSKLNLRSNTPNLQGSIQITGGDANTPGRFNFPLSVQKDTRCKVLEVNPNEIIVQIPSSVPILRRSLKGSAHPRDNKTKIYSDVELFDFSTLGVSSMLNIDIDGTPYIVNFTHALDFANPTEVSTEEVIKVINGQLTFLESFTNALDGYKKVGLQTTEGSSEYQVTGGSANSILNFPTALQQDLDLIDTGFPSSYIFDPVGQLFTVTGITSELASQVNQGSVYANVTLSNAAGFPNSPGKVLFDFGRNNQEGPIAYSSRPNNATLLIDASHTFQYDHIIGRKVNFISDKPSIPRLTGEDYPVYIVGTDEAREAAQTLIKRLLAAGVVIRFIIDFPEVLFECTCRGCGPSDDPDYKGFLTGQGPLVF